MLIVRLRGFCLEMRMRKKIITARKLSLRGRQDDKKGRNTIQAGDKIFLEKRRSRQNQLCINTKTKHLLVKKITKKA